MYSYTCPRPKYQAPNSASRPDIFELTLINIDEFEKGEMVNKRTARNTLYKWYGWLISHIFKTVKNSIINVKEGIVNIFPKDNRQKSCR